MAGLALMPADTGGVLAGLGPRGLDWLAMLAIPPLAALIAWVATRAAALRVLRRAG
jgi:cell division transport system permease protein